MFKKISFTATLLLSFIFVGCGGSDDETGGSTVNNITLSTTTLNFSGVAGSQSLTVTTDHEWAATTSDSWISVTPKNSPKGTATVSVTVQKNGEFDGRQGTITIMSGSARAYITVNQEGGDGVPDPNAITCPFEGYKLVWHDEFDKGNSLNPDDWTHEVQGSGWVNHELQNYVNEKTPDGTWVTRIKDGILNIRCLKENGKVYSGRVYAKAREGWTYGYIEARIKLPKGKGTWPAFWMMPVNFRSWPADGEIDIMEEVGANPNYVSSSLHANAHVHSNNTQVTHEMYLAGAEDDYHVYAIKWTQGNITTYVDGKVQLSYDNRGLGRNDWPYDDPFYVILNLAWGGDWGGYKGIDESALPATMLVDYVRVFQKK